MKKPIVTVFLVIAVLVLVFLVWQIFFRDGGVIQTAWNSVIGTVNEQYGKISGGKALLPEWRSSTEGDGTEGLDGVRIR